MADAIEQQEQRANDQRAAASRVQWFKQSEKPFPLNERIIWTDGKSMVIGSIGRIEGMNHAWFYSEHVEGCGGWDWECLVPAESVTHWAYAPEFP